MMIRTRSRRSALAAALALAAAACDGGGGSSGGGTLPTTDPVQLALVSGSGQEAAPGERLREVLTVRATRNGLPVSGVQVTFAAAPGSGIAQTVEGITNLAGEAYAFWHLPAERAPGYTLTASVAGADPVVFRSTPVPPERLDAVYTDYAGPVRLLVYERERFPEDERLFSATLRDSLLISPFDDPRRRTEAVAFAAGHPPLLLDRIAWTSARDSLRLQFLPRVRVPMTLWVVDGPWEEVGALARTQAQNARDAWRAAGVELEITIVDATRYPGAAKYQDVMVEMCRNGVAEAIGTVPGHLNAYYVWDVHNTEFNQGGQGVHCGGGHIELASGDTRASHLLAHEVGHAFTLDHTRAEGNVMHFTAAGPDIVLGQWFRSHLYALSWIQVNKLESQPSVSRSCHTLTYDQLFDKTAPCPTEGFR
jgi:hypothetical protein